MNDSKHQQCHIFYEVIFYQWKCTRKPLREQNYQKKNLPKNVQYMNLFLVTLLVCKHWNKLTRRAIQAVASSIRLIRFIASWLEFMAKQQASSTGEWLHLFWTSTHPPVTMIEEHCWSRYGKYQSLSAHVGSWTVQVWSSSESSMLQVWFWYSADL